MCNLYSELKSQTAVRQWARAMHDRAGNLPPLPAILRTADEIDTWLKAPISEALGLQRPLPDGALKIVPSGVQEDHGQ